MDVTLAFEHQDAKVYAKNLIFFAQLNSDFIFFHIQSIYIASKKIRQLVANECENIISEPQNNGPVNCIAIS